MSENSEQSKKSFGKKTVEGLKKITSLSEWENHISARIDDQEDKINGLLEREDWVRNRFEEQDEKINDLLKREDWTRNRFEEQQKQIEKLKKEVLYSSDGKSMEIQDCFYNKKTYSQSGEDAIISYVLNFLEKDLTKITYLDLGANHAVEMSNTYAYYQNGCSGVLIEANPELIPELKKYRQNDVIINKAIAFDSKDDKIDFYVLSGDGLSTIDYQEAMNACKVNPGLSIKQVYQIETISIKEILETYFKEEGPTILSIDLEGIEEKILSEFDFKTYRPLAIILENIPYHPYLVIEDREDKAGDILRENQYIEYAFTGINSIYVDKTAIEAFNAKRKGELTKEGE